MPTDLSNRQNDAITFALHRIRAGGSKAIEHLSRSGSNSEFIPKKKHIMYASTVNNAAPAEIRLHSMPLPANIGEVITALEYIMDDCERKNNRLGYFAALYHKVTCRVRDGIANDEFENGPRMEQLDVTFANRYIAAYRTFQEGLKPTSSWDLSFIAARKRRVLVLQHLLLGMNAHINLDLGIAAAEIAKNAGMQAIRKDFAAINGILALLSGDVLNNLRRVSPFLSLLGLHQSRYNSILIQFSIANARDGAWCFAEELFNASEKQEEIIRGRDAGIAELANGILQTTGLMRITLWLIHLFEWRKPARIIQQMRRTSPAVIKTRKSVVG